MGRIRTIKPEILTDEKTVDLTDSAWRLWVSMWLIADDQGNLGISENVLIGQVFPTPKKGRPKVGNLLDELERFGFILRYTCRGQTYANIPGWEKHQKINKPGKPRVPGPLDEGSKFPGNPPENPGKPQNPRADLSTPTVGPPTSDPDRRTSDPDPSTDPVDQVISYYKRLHPGFKGTQKDERKLIRMRLKEGFSVADLCRAIDGNHVSPFHCGRNKDGTKHHKLELIVRNGSQVNMFIEKLEESSMPTMSEAGRETVTSMQRFLERERKRDAQS